MDVVLDILDTFFFDRLYATLLPASSIHVAQNVVKSAATTTFSSMREAPTPYSFASQYAQLEPSPYAYMSAWRRDNIYRQALSLYFITW